MITNTALYSTIIFSVICLIYFAVMVFIKKVFQNVEEDYKNLKTGQKLGNNDDKEAFLANLIMGGDHRAKVFQDACDRVLKETLFLFSYQSISVAIAGLIVSVTFLIWFSLNDQYLWFVIPFIIGILATALNTLLVLVLTTKSRPRVLFAAQEEKETTFFEGFIINTSIVSGVLSVFILTILFVIPFVQDLYFDSFDKKKNLTNSLFNTVAFAVGVSLASIFYRDLGSTFAKGVSIGSNVIDNKLNNNTSSGVTANSNLKYSFMIGDSFSSNVTSTLDLQCLISTLIVTTMLLSQGSDDVHLTLMYLVLYLFSLNLLITFVVSWLSKFLQSTFKDQPTSQYVASQIKIQYIVINIIAFLLLFFLPIEIATSDISLGKDGAKNPSFFNSEVSKGDVIWSLQIGQVIAFVLVFLTEFWTSYGFSFVRSISKKLQSTTLSEGIVAAEASGNISTAVFLFLLGFSVYLGYYFGGVFGLGWLALGAIQTAPMLLSVCYLSVSASDGVQICNLNGLEQLCNRLRLINWSTLNYSSFIQLINISAGFFVNVLCVAAVIFLADQQKETLFSGTAILGLILGFVLVSVIKSINTFGIQAVSQSLINGSKDVQQGKKIEETNLKSLNNIILELFTPSFFSVLINLAAIIVTVLFTSLLLGTAAVVGLALGLTIFGAAFSLNQLIVGTSLKNAQNYIDQSILISGESSEKKIVNLSSKECGQYAQSLHAIPGTSIANYAHFALLLLVIGAKTFKDYGYLDSYLNDNSSKVSGATVDWYLDLVGSDSKSKGK